MMSFFLFGKLAKRFNILIEENVGLHVCVVTAHNLIHAEEDVFRFLLPDNYWCFPFERAVKKYICIPNNDKNIECSFAKKEQRRAFLKSLKTEETSLPQAAMIDVDKVIYRETMHAQLGFDYTVSACYIVKLDMSPMVKNKSNMSTVLQFSVLIIIVVP